MVLNFTSHCPSWLDGKHTFLDTLSKDKMFDAVAQG
jgi:hypothetical protein